MTIPLTIRSGTTRQYPEQGDGGYFGEATNWAQDVTNAVNATANAAAVWEFDAVVGSAAEVSAGTATHDSIQDALDDASTGWVIYIKSGTFTQSTVLEITKSVTLIGSGLGTIINSEAGIGSGAIIKPNASGITLWNLYIKVGTGTPDYAIELGASCQRCEVNIKADIGFAIDTVYNNVGDNRVAGFVADTLKVTHLADPKYTSTFDATTDWGAAAGGIYTISSLPPGTGYKVRICPPLSQGQDPLHWQGWHRDVLHRERATPVSVQTGPTTNLEVTHLYRRDQALPTGRITGRVVVENTSQGIGGCQVQAFVPYPDIPPGGPGSHPGLGRGRSGNEGGRSQAAGDPSPARVRKRRPGGGHPSRRHSGLPDPAGEGGGELAHGLPAQGPASPIASTARK